MLVIAYLLGRDVAIGNVCVLAHHRHVRNDVNRADVASKDAHAAALQSRRYIPAIAQVRVIPSFALAQCLANLLHATTQSLGLVRFLDNLGG